MTVKARKTGIFSAKTSLEVTGSVPTAVVVREALLIQTQI